MAQRLRLYDFRISRFPPLLGLCKDDVPRICEYVNAAQARLLNAKEAGDESWWGTWAEILFNVSRDQPYITLPREIARIESINVCDHPRPVRNQFFEYLQFGNGRLPKHFSTCNPCRQVQALTRNNAVTFTDLSTPPQYIAAYPTEQQDVGKRIFFQGLDNNNVRVISQDVFNRVDGIFVPLAFPFVAAPMQFNAITGIQKDVTAGPVHIFQVNPSTGAQILLLTMDPSETTAWYRRYYLDSLPISCCPSVPSGATACQTPTSQLIQVTAIAKLDLIPVVTDTDYCLIQNIEALGHECQAVRYSGIDTSSAKGFETYHHNQAIGLLNGELSHYLGKNQVAINLAVFGSARLENQRIGVLI